MQVTPADVLMAVDIQNDFCTGGPLAVPGGEQVIPVLHHIAPLFAHVVLTQDWHPDGHISFAATHPGRAPFEQIQLPYGLQTLWPQHCVQGSPGAAFHPALRLPQAELVQRKGIHPAIDSYSAFFENDRTTPTGLDGYLRENGLRRLFLAGLAYDFCVAYSALDGRRLGFEVVIVRDGCRSIDLDGSVTQAEAEFARAGVQLIDSADLTAAHL